MTILVALTDSTTLLWIAPISAVLLAAFVIVRGRQRYREKEQRVSTHWLDENVRERRE